MESSLRILVLKRPKKWPFKPWEEIKTLPGGIDFFEYLEEKKRGKTAPYSANS